MDTGLGKKQRMPNGAGGTPVAGAAAGPPPPTADVWAEMKAKMEGLSNQMVGVRTDIVDVKRDLGEKIQKGNEATDELRARMDENDRTFARRVAEVVAGGPGAGFPALSSTCLLYTSPSPRD